MTIDVLIEYDGKLSEVTFSSKTVHYSETRPARIGLSRQLNGDSGYEMVEFVGEDWELVENVHDLFKAEPSRKGWVLRVINPLASATFEPFPAFQMISHFAHVLLSKYYPKTWTWRMSIPFITTYDLTLKVPGYNFFNPQKKAEFEKLLRGKFKNMLFIS